MHDRVASVAASLILARRLLLQRMEVVISAAVAVTMSSLPTVHLVAAKGNVWSSVLLCLMTS